MARDVFHPVVAEHWRSTMLLSYIVLLHFLPAWIKNHHRPIFAASSVDQLINPIYPRDTLWLCQNSY